VNSTATKKDIAIVIFQLGGPDSLDAVEPFLYNLFCDPDIIDLPGAFLFRRKLARFISTRRAPKVQKLYERIGRRSPILKQTTLQARALKASLTEHGVHAEIYIAMRYWHPLTEEVLRKVIAENPSQVVFLPLYPHYSKTTTGSSMHEWNRLFHKLNVDHFQSKLVESYYDHPLYITALVNNIRRALRRVPEAERRQFHLVFSAHGTPMKLVRNGDPYSQHIRRTYELVIQEGNFNLPHRLCFQSKVGPQKWLQPSLTQTIEDLGRDRASHVLVVPIAFVSDHIETLSEINMEAREQAHAAGIKHFDMMPALITNKEFISCLTDLVMKQLRN
jgi:protoporphyrin/coproporphyrin ferrochelatase